jgi:hypothetical protein
MIANPQERRLGKGTINNNRHVCRIYIRSSRNLILDSIKHGGLKIRVGGQSVDINVCKGH